MDNSINSFTTRSKMHFDSLDIFRGIFASMIVLFHLRAYTISPILNNNIVANSFLFVNFFFVLSGFVISYNYESLTSFNEVSRFMVKRFKRIYPLHLFLLLVFLFYFIAKKVAMGLLNVEFLFADDNWKNFICSLFLIHSIRIEGFNESLSWNYPSWSISAEMIAYFIFSLCELLIYKLRITKARVFILAGFICFYIYSHFQPNSIYNLALRIDNGYLQGLAGFYFGAFGVIIYRYIKGYSHYLNIILFSFIEFFLIISVLTCVYNGKFLLEKTGLWLFSTVFLVVILVFALQRGYISLNIKKLSFLRNMGLYSYSIYMNHLIVILLFNFILTRVLKLSPWYYNFLFVIVYIIVYKISAITHKYIELRFTRKSNLKKGV